LIESLIRLLNSIPADKVFHFASGVILFASTVHFIGSFYSMIVVASIGIIKEVYDMMHKDKHTPDFMDALATIIGGIVAYSCTIAKINL